MLGAAVWQDRQGTTVNSDESPRERPPQPPPRHRAAAFPIEPADPSAAESRGGGSGRRRPGAGAGPGAPSRARGAGRGRGRAQVPSRPRAPRAASASRLLSSPRAAARTWTSVPPLRRQSPAQVRPLEGALETPVALELRGRATPKGRRALGHPRCLRPNPCQALGEQ